MNPTRCISCGEPMAPGAERAPSLGNRNQCVPCCTGHQLPAPGLTGASGEIWPDVGPKVGRLGAVARPAADQTCSTAPDAGDCARFPAEGSAAYRATDGPTTLPPATAPAACISRDAGPETTAAGGNPLTSDLYVDTPQNAARYTVHTEAAASEVNPFPAGRWPAGTLCIKCGAPIEEHWLATVCCADCRAGFGVPAPTRSGVHYLGPAYSPEDCDAWRMLL